MKVLMVHNYYQVSGGEESVLDNEIKLLKDHGHDVVLSSVSNESISSFFGKLITFFFTPFSFSQYKKMQIKIAFEKPDVVHVHNYFPRFSPSIFYACKSTGVPVVHTLHNFRSICPTATLMHDGRITKRSIYKSSWWAVSKRVYRKSYLGSFALTCMVELHKYMGTWQSKVDRFIALTEFSRDLFVDAGWPAQKVVVKPNFIDDPIGKEELSLKKGGYALYVGRLSEEKGVDILLEAWRGCKLPLKIVGDGPLRKSFSESNNNNVAFLGAKGISEVLELVKNAEFIVMPSRWYETFGMVIIEAFACATPVIVTDLGSMRTLVEDGITGLHFELNNSNDLRKKINWMISHPEEVFRMGRKARNEYLAKYTPEKSYKQLLKIYNEAILEARRSSN